MDQPNPQAPDQQHQPLDPERAPTSDAPWETLGPGGAPDPGPAPDGDPSAYVDDEPDDGTRFEPLDAAGGRPKVPFTDEEILDGTAMVAMLAAARATRIQFDEADVETFKRAYKNIFPPFITTATVIAPLKLGDALAQYGIHKNMGPGFDLAAVPALARLAIGAVLLGTSTVMATTAVAKEHAGHREQPKAADRDPLNTDPPGAPQPPEPEASPPDAGDAPAAEPQQPPTQPTENGVRPGQAWA